MLGKTCRRCDRKDNPGNHNSFRGIFSYVASERCASFERPAQKTSPEDNKKEDIQRHPLVLKLSAIIC